MDRGIRYTASMARTLGGGLLILLLTGAARFALAPLLPASVSDGLKFGLGIWLASLVGGVALFLLAPPNTLAFTRPTARAMAGALALSVALTALFDGARWLSTGHLIPQDWAALMGSRTAAIVLGLAVVVAAPIFEEAFFRGFVQSGLTPKLGPAITIGLTSFFFMLAHAPPDAIGALDPLLSGVALGLMRHRTGTILPGIAFHALGNAQAVALALA